MTLVSNTCGEHPLEQVEGLHPYYVIESRGGDEVEVFDCGMTTECAERKRSLGIGSVRGDTFEVVLVKSSAPVFIDDPETEDWDCFEQDTIRVKFDFSGATTATEIRTLSNEMSGEGCPAFIEAFPDAINYDGCSAAFSYTVEKI